MEDSKHGEPLCIPLHDTTAFGGNHFQASTRAGLKAAGCHPGMPSSSASGDITCLRPFMWGREMALCSSRLWPRVEFFKKPKTQPHPEILNSFAPPLLGGMQALRKAEVMAARGCGMLCHPAQAVHPRDINGGTVPCPPQLPSAAGGAQHGPCPHTALVAAPVPPQ